METDVGHRISPERFWNIFRKSKESTDQQENSLQLQLQLNYISSAYVHERASRVIDLNSSSDDDTHEKIGNSTGYSHHQALNNSNASKKTENEKEIVRESWVKLYHKITYSSGEKCYDHQKRHGGDCVAYHKWQHTIVPIKSLSLKNLHFMHQYIYICVCVYIVLINQSF